MHEECYPPLIVILGPTACGKSELALNLSLKIGGEIISADSRQIYKELLIGTAKPSAEDCLLVPHHLVDIISPGEEFTLYDFQKMAMDTILDVYRRGKRPLLVGGTGLYIKAVTEGLVLPVTSPDYEYRSYLKELASEKGTEYLHDMLSRVDREASERIHHNDLRRIVRALEVFKTGSVALSGLQKNREPLPFKCMKFGILWQRETLYRLIEERIDRMFASGLVDEVLKLMSKGYSFESPPLDAVGYPETADYLKGKSTMSEALRLIKRNTRHFSKRQMTWFRKDKDIVWFEPEKGMSKEDMVKEIIRSIDGLPLLF